MSYVYTVRGQFRLEYARNASCVSNTWFIPTHDSDADAVAVYTHRFFAGHSVRFVFAMAPAASSDNTHTCRTRPRGPPRAGNRKTR